MRLIFLIGSFLVLSAPVYTQIDPEVKADYDQLMNVIVNQYDAVGISAAVRVGDDMWAGAAGISSVEEDLTTEHTFGIGSTTKTFVSATILQLMEEGELSLSDPISDFLPDYEHIDGSLTIKQLLYHTSGLYNYTSHPDFFPAVVDDLEYIYTPEEVLSTYIEEPIAAPDTEQEYSNTNYLLLGMIIKSITGNEFYDEVVERFDTATNYPSLSMPPFQSLISDMAHLWLDTTFTGTQPQVDCIENDWVFNSFFSAAEAAGAFAATPTDMANWAYDLYSGNLLEPASMDSLFDTHPFLLSGIIPYGLGVFQAQFGCGASGWGHNGNIIYTSSMYYIPEYDLSLSVLTNDGSQIPSVGGLENVANELACLYIEFVTGVEEDAQIETTIYPNPSTGTFTIQTSEELVGAPLTVYDLQGKEILQTNCKAGGQTQIELNGLPSGTYILVIQDREKVIREKLFVLPN